MNKGKDINLIPRELAKIFYNMKPERQAEFFSEVSKIFKTHSSNGLEDLDYIAYEDIMYPHGIDFINKMYEFLL